MSWNSNAPIRFKLGTVAIWNLLNRRVVKNDVSLGVLRGAAPAFFEDLISAPTPATLEGKK